MASRAFAAIWTHSELSLVWIGLVAVGTFREDNRLFEITAAVALNAPDRGMFSEQRELGLRVIKLVVQARRKLLPSAAVVTGLATLRERAVMRIAMAIRTLPKRNAGVTRLVIRTGRVALFARNLHVHPD